MKAGSELFVLTTVTLNDLLLSIDRSVEDGSSRLRKEYVLSLEELGGGEGS